MTLTAFTSCSRVLPLMRILPFCPMTMLHPVSLRIMFTIEPFFPISLGIFEGVSRMMKPSSTLPRSLPSIDRMGVLLRSMSTIFATMMSPTSRMSGMTMSVLKGASMASGTLRTASVAASMSTSQWPSSMSVTSPITRSPARGLKPASRAMTDTMPLL